MPHKLKDLSPAQRSRYDTLKREMAALWERRRLKGLELLSIVDFEDEEERMREAMRAEDPYYSFICEELERHKKGLPPRPLPKSCNLLTRTLDILA